MFNLAPVIGVAFYDWVPFDMFWLFWLETLIISLFNAIRILFSQGRSMEDVSAENALKLNFLPALKYLLIRTAIFIFYALFIIVFIGFLSPAEADSLNVVRTLAFQNVLFNIAIIISIATQALYLAKYFFMNGAFVYARKDDFPGIFDARQIVIHVAVVLGAVGSAFLFEDTSRQEYASVWIICIFCVTKFIFEIYGLYTNRNAVG